MVNVDFFGLPYYDPEVEDSNSDLSAVLTYEKF